ncbi:PREDICTED: hepatitis A virus cellular receptor 1 homolog [Capra hircus]|uniref:hepatitis A virus cellular receptor 1 homolog n=1 Tax=Capra hircus TaxID=9925 RepID=UPI0008476664|nr:PREDICTED: hepatitis A virus cellular receptor 1 homolog [Capra hircus]
MKGRPDFLSHLTVQGPWVSKISVPGVNRRDTQRKIVISELLESIQDVERENAPDANGVTSYRQVIGVVGQSVTLPCFYEGKVTSICWGRGKCSWIDCRNTVISTDGYKVTEQKNERYKFKGDIGKRDVSLTIENAVLSDSGLYCCRIKKWLFNDEENIIKLTIKSAPPTTTVSPSTTSESPSTTNIPRTTYTTPPTRNTTIPERNSTTTVVTDTHMTTGASTSALPMPTPTEDHKPAPPTTTVSPSTTSESTRTSITNIPRTTYTTAPKRKTTIPERNSTTTVVTDTHTTTGASTSALPMPTPTEDHKPASSSSPTQTTRTRSTCPHKTNVTHSPWHSTTSAGGNNTVINLPRAVCCSIQTSDYAGFKKETSILNDEIVLTCQTEPISVLRGGKIVEGFTAPT